MPRVRVVVGKCRGVRSIAARGPRLDAGGPRPQPVAYPQAQPPPPPPPAHPRKVPKKPSKAEVELNPRARSAVLRAAERASPGDTQRAPERDLLGGFVERGRAANDDGDEAAASGGASSGL